MLCFVSAKHHPVAPRSAARVVVRTLLQHQGTDCGEMQVDTRLFHRDERTLIWTDYRAIDACRVVLSHVLSGVQLVAVWAAHDGPVAFREMRRKLGTTQDIPATLVCAFHVNKLTVVTEMGHQFV